MTATPLVKLAGVSHRFRQGDADVPALSDVSITIAAGEFVIVMGPSGSGKSTLVHVIAGLLTPTAGQVEVCGHSLATMSEADRARLRRRQVGVVFQAFNLLPALTVAENVALPLLLDGRSDVDTDARVDETLRAVGLEGRRHHLADQLSGGEGQRVAIARALAVRPSLILADEPTGNLDRATGATILSLLEHAQRSFGSTIVLVTHDERGATYGSRILHLADGRVTADRSEAA